MNDLIRKQEATTLPVMPKEHRAYTGYQITSIDTIYEQGWLDCQACIENIQPVHIDGYNIEHLMMIAAVMEKEGVSPEKAVHAFADIGRMADIIAKDFQQTLHNALDNYFNVCEDSKR